jgi:hypothetical protein
VRQPLRLAATLLVSAAVAVAGISVATPAQADPVIDLNWSNVTGQTVVKKPNVTITVPQSTFNSKLDLGTGELVGDMKIPDLTMKMKLFGHIPVTSTVRMVPVGPTTAKVHLVNDTIDSTTTFTLQVLRVSQDWIPKVNLVPTGCTTSKPSVATMKNTTPIDIFKGTTLEGTYTIPSFKNCGLLTPALTLLMSGPGNTMTLTLK